MCYDSSVQNITSLRRNIRMKNYKRITCGCLSAAVMFTALAVTPVTAQAAAMKLNKSSATLTVGKKLTLKVQNGKKGAKVKWSTSQKSVATVTQKGVVTAKAEGKATIKAVVNKVTLKCNVTVNDKVVTDENATDITAALAGKTYKGNAEIPGVGNMNVMNLTFGEDGAVSGSMLSETTFQLEEFAGTYKAMLSGKKVNITVTADGETFTYGLTVEKEDYSRLSAKQKVGALEITVVIEEVKEEQ